MIKYTTEFLKNNENTTVQTLAAVADKVHCKMAVNGKHAIGLTWKQLRCAHFKNYFGLKSHFAAMYVFEDYTSKTIEGQKYEQGKLYLVDKTGMLTEFVADEDAFKKMVHRIKQIKKFDKSIKKMNETVEAC